MNQNGHYSSEEEDGDEKWKAAIHSAAAVDFAVYAQSGTTKLGSSALDSVGMLKQEKTESQGLKLYQTRAQKILYDMLEDSFEFVNDHSHISISPINEHGIRLFGKAPPGIALETHGTCPRPKKKPCIIPHGEINEKSKEFRHHIRHAAVDGAAIIADAQNAAKRSLARYEARNIEAKAAAKREEVRVAELKKLRGEKWLPSIAREMQVKPVNNGRKC